MLSLYLLTTFTQFLMSSSGDYLVPDTDTMIFEIFSATSTDVVHSNSNYCGLNFPLSL